MDVENELTLIPEAALFRRVIFQDSFHYSKIVIKLESGGSCFTVLVGEMELTIQNQIIYISLSV